MGIVELPLLPMSQRPKEKPNTLVCLSNNQTKCWEINGYTKF